MKAVAVDRRSGGNILGVKKDSNSRIMKMELSEDKFALSEEMKECLLQLSTMVPSVPRTPRGDIDVTSLMSDVIDYILDLEDQLGAGQVLQSLHPSLRVPGQTLQGHTCREPLSEKSIDNIRAALPPAPAPREPLAPRTTDCEIRPPSK